MSVSLSTPVRPVLRGSCCSTQVVSAVLIGLRPAPTVELVLSRFKPQAGLPGAVDLLWGVVPPPHVPALPENAVTLLLSLRGGAAETLPFGLFFADLSLFLELVRTEAVGQGKRLV